jgi:glycosyltransferase involved in cell wall biosynthesis
LSVAPAGWNRSIERLQIKRGVGEHCHKVKAQESVGASLAFRVLTQINYSAGENPEGDSGLHFTAGLLHSLVSLDFDLHFYVLIPIKHEDIWVNALSHPRITPITIDIEPRLHGGDFQFNPTQLYRNFDLRRFDIDLLFLNQPETAPAFLHFFNKEMFYNIPAVSYVHWFDTRIPSRPKQTVHRPILLGALSGMMVSSAVGCNSAYGRKQILDYAGHWFNEETINSLEQRLRLLPPAVDVAEVEFGRMKKNERKNKRIIVNHRLLKYTGVRALLTKALPELWERRQDFSVLVTNPSHVRLPGTITNVPWLTVETLSRQAYFRKLWESDIVVAPHRATHWSISTLEAICAECVPLMNKESFFAEMMGPLISGMADTEKKHIETRWFFHRGSIVNRLSDLLDNLNEDRNIVKRVAEQSRSIYDWGVCAQAWSEMFREVELESPIIAADNPSLLKIIELIKQKGAISKAEILRRFRWAPKQRTLSWTAFRRRLKSIAPDDSSSADVVFKLREDSNTI